ncbi:MAG: hypothetical protein QM488_13535 [Rhizobiaceae bacterium]
MILIGFTFAVIAAGMFLSFGLVSEYFAEFFADVDPSNNIEGVSIFMVGLYMGAHAGGASFFPAVVIIAIAEIMRWKGMIINLLLGGLCSVFVGVIGSSIGNAQTLSESTLIILLATGFIGGFIYWLIAGRKAGAWMEKPAEPAT